MNKSFYFFITVFFFSVTTLFSQPLSQDAEARLLSFCELYSTVKYYYPEPNLQDFPWDAFAYQGYKIATTSKNDKGFIKKIDRLFYTIAPGVQISKKEFNIAGIRPSAKDAALYPEKAFWQHQGGLNADRASYTNYSTLNYIYKKPTDIYRMEQWIAAEPNGLLGKKLRFSLWAKVDGNSNSIKVFSFKTTDRDKKGAKIVEAAIKVSGNQWKRYIVEMEHPDSIIYSIWTLFHPTKGTVYVDDLKLERFENGAWEEIKIYNSNFEHYSSEGYSYSSLGYLNGWRDMFYYGALAIADSINVIEGKYCLKLPTVQNKLWYLPALIDQPHIVSLPMGYKAYIPLQLYANEKTVFPVSDKKQIKNLTEKLRKDSLSTNQLAIACLMQTWAALYQDYPYREDDFEDKLNRLFFQTVNKLDTTKAANLYTIIYNDFAMWINDPHLSFQNGSKFLTDNKARETRINIPIQQPDPICLTETQCVVTNVIDSVTNLQIGDVILQINDLSIDSLLQLYRAHNLSRYTQRRTLERLMTIYGEPEVKVRLLRNGETVDVVFSTYTRQKDWSKTSLEKENREKYQALQDSLKEAKGLFYLNAMYSPDVFYHNRLSDRYISNRYHATDSLITELNQYKALILDVRGYPEGRNVLPFLTEYMGVGTYDRAIFKTAFMPVAQFNKRNLLVSVPEREEMLIQVPVYVLIDNHTISYPEMILRPLKASGRATFIGSNTAGAAGSVCYTKITNGITLWYTTGQSVGLDNNPMSYQGTGIPPDIYAYPTPQGIAEGRDEVLEKAIEVAMRNIEEKKSLMK